MQHMTDRDRVGSVISRSLSFSTARVPKILYQSTSKRLACKTYRVGVAHRQRVVVVCLVRVEVRPDFVDVDWNLRFAVKRKRRQWKPASVQKHPLALQLHSKTVANQSTASTHGTVMLPPNTYRSSILVLICVWAMFNVSLRGGNQGEGQGDRQRASHGCSKGSPSSSSSKKSSLESPTRVKQQHPCCSSLCFGRCFCCSATWMCGALPASTTLADTFSSLNILTYKKYIFPSNIDTQY